MTGSKKKIKPNYAIELVNIYKEYLVHHEKPTLAEKILKGKNKVFVAIKNLSLNIKHGERVGLIGPNGSGKTTLLKLITGISNPTTGKVKTTGKIVSLIDLEAGFHPDMTGYQNIYLNGLLIGMSQKEVESKMKDIVSLANIGQFIDTQLFTYSQGMKLRLGFSTAINSNPDILILDENIAVGDQNFSVTSYEKIQSLLKENKTLVIASHNMEFIRTFCNRAVWIENGEIVADGKTESVIKKYQRGSHKS